jgi:uncharacterized protein
MKLIVASFGANAGKSSVTLGLMKGLQGRATYLKPLGDRLVYKKKRLWDHDAATINQLFDLGCDSESMTLGFAHDKLSYMYNQESIKEALNEMVDSASADREITLIEAGSSLTCGRSINLSPLDMAATLNCKIVLVASGKPHQIIDELTHLAGYVDRSLIEGVVVNQQSDVTEFNDLYAAPIKKLGFSLLGVLPYNKELSRLSVQQVSDGLLAKVITGERSLHNAIDHIDVGSMSVNEAARKNIFKKDNNLIILSGDRSDVALVAMEHNPSAFIMTNGILPTKNIITIASGKSIPILSVEMDTFSAAKKVDDMQSVIYIEDVEKIERLSEMVRDNLKIENII